MIDYGIYEKVDIVIAIIQKLKCTKNNFTDLILFPSNDYSPHANWFRMSVEQLTWSNFFQAEKDTWIDRFLKHGDPGNMLLVRAIERANEVDKKRITKRPSILFYLIKQMSPEILVQGNRDAREMSPALVTSPNDKKQLMTRKRSRSKQ
jgi:hypothetical protein